MRSIWRKSTGLDIIIEGSSEAHLVADEIADAEVPVVFGRITERMLHQNDAYQRRSPHAPAVLEAAGVDWVIGSGAMGSGEARFVLQNAQLASRHAHGPKLNPLELVTARAADFLGVGDRIGRIQRGRAADLVVWSGDPLDPASRVQRVYVAGKEVYTSEDDARRRQVNEPPSAMRPSSLLAIAVGCLVAVRAGGGCHDPCGAHDCTRRFHRREQAHRPRRHQDQASLRRRRTERSRTTRIPDAVVCPGLIDLGSTLGVRVDRITNQRGRSILKSPAVNAFDRIRT